MYYSKQFFGQCGWLKKEDAYMAVGHFVYAVLVQSACWNCSLFLYYAEICGGG